MHETRSSLARWLGVARKVGVAAAGIAVLAAGVALVFLPGPAFVVIPVGLGILGTEFPWARRINTGLRRKLERIARSALARFKRAPPQLRA